MANRFHLALAILPVLFGLSVNAASAQDDPRHEQIVEQANKIAVKVVAGELDEISTQLATEMAIVLDEPEELRVLPVLSRGGENNISDLLYLDGVDVSIVRTDVLNSLKSNSAFREANERLRYISKLHNEEVYLLAGPSFETVEALAGQKVNFGRTSLENSATPNLVFSAVGIEVEQTFLDQDAAIEKIKAGELAATVVVGVRGNDVLSSLKAEDGLRLLPIAFEGDLQELYLPVSLTSEDYPGLIAPDQTVDTLATSVAMVTYGWPKGHARYKRVNRFVKAFFSKFDDFRKSPRHPKWSEVNISAAMPGWIRFEPAETWLNEYAEKHSTPPAFFRLRSTFESFLSAQRPEGAPELPEERRREMFKAFLSWTENQTEAVIQVRAISETDVGEIIGTITARNIEADIDGDKQPALLLAPRLNGLTPGRHAFLIYENPDCGPAEWEGEQVAGLAAGQRLGTIEEGDGNASDTPYLQVGSDGTVSQELIAPNLSLANLLDRSIIVHADASESSRRQACGVIN